jgi:hypothetical protein
MPCIMSIKILGSPTIGAGFEIFSTYTKLHRSQELWLQIEQRHICRVDKRSASTMSTLVDALRLSTLQVSS